MNLTSADIAALKSPDVLQAFISQYEDYKGMKNGKPSFTCRIHAHKHPDKAHIRLDEHKGKAVAICDSYGVIGDIFNVCREYTGESDFRKQVEAVAAAVGYNLTPDDGNTPKKGRRSRKAGFSRPLAVPARPVPVEPVGEPLEYLLPDEEAAALDAVRRLAASPNSQARWAELLGLPLSVIKFHSDIQEAGALGLLGLDERARLLYVYTHRPADGEPVRVVGVKTRNLPGVEPRFLMRGSKQVPWGWDAVEAAGLVFVTEGESDALAVRAALWAWLDYWSHNEPHTYPAEEDLPVAVGKPDAGTFRDTWARRLVGKDVVLVVDNDDAGRKGAEKTAGIMRAAGVRRVFLWTPPAGAKDARAALDAARPWLLADDLMGNRKEIRL